MNGGFFRSRSMSRVPSAVETEADLLMAGSLPARSAVADDQPSMTRDREHRVVFYLNSAEEKVEMRLTGNITHLQQALGPDCHRVELVVHGPGPSSPARWRGRNGTTALNSRSVPTR